jgi:hypothetical protein
VKPRAWASGFLLSIVKAQQIRAGTRHDSICVPLVVAKLDEGSFIVKQLHDCSDLAARKTLVGYIGEQCHYV